MLNQTTTKNQVGEKVALSGPQKEAVEYGNGPLLIAAGAGSGKTRTLTQRLIRLIQNGVLPEKIVAITFTNKAAGEMKKRIEPSLPKKATAKAPFIGTFHSFCARILRKEARKLGRTPSYVIFDDNDSKKLIRKVLKLVGSPDGQTPAKVSRELSRIKNNLLDPTEVEEPIKTIYETYEKELARQNAFDFDDLIEKVVALFRGNPSTLEKYQKMYSHILVDEYQDINTSQYELVRLLCKKHGNLTVVGDDQQSIYGFRWSDFTNFLNFEKDWPGARVIKLGENYRSTSNIVRAAAGVIENNKLQRRKKLWTENEEGDPVFVVGVRDEEEEADLVADKILERGRTGGAAVLYRTNAQSRAIEQALNFHAIPYDIFGGIRFYERKEIKDIVAALRFALNPKDEISKERIEKTFRKKIREELVENLPELAEKLSVLELLGYILKTTDYFEYLTAQFKNSEERAENVAELVRFANSFSSLTDFLERISLLQASDKVGEEKNRAVRLMTIHLAKGLEFRDVYIVGANEGLLPHQRSLLSQEEVEEERRLAYVAMTRAKERLHISFYSFASRFLYEIPPELIDFKNSDTLSEEDIYLD